MNEQHYATKAIDAALSEAAATGRRWAVVYAPISRMRDDGSLFIESYNVAGSAKAARANRQGNDAVAGIELVRIAKFALIEIREANEQETGGPLEGLRRRLSAQFASFIGRGALGLRPRMRVVDRLQLISALTEAKLACERKSEIPILRHVLLEVSGDSLTVTGTDLDVSVRRSIPAVSARAGARAIPAKQILKWLTACETPEISVTFDVNYAVSFSAVAGQTATVFGMSPESFPMPPAKIETRLEIDGLALESLLNNTLFAVSVTESRAALDGILLEVQPGGIAAVGTDGRRMAIQRFASNEFSADQQLLLLSSEAARILLKLIAGHPGRIMFGWNELYLAFRLPGAELIARRMSGDFPDYRKVIPSNEGRHAVPLDYSPLAALRSAVQRVRSFGSRAEPGLLLGIGHGELSVRTSLNENGEATETLLVDFEAPKTEIMLNGQYLADAIEHAQAPCELRSADDKSVVEIADDSGFRCLVMPMRR